MLLYHGSNIDIKEIVLAMCRPYKDFGKGFYLSVFIPYREGDCFVKESRCLTMGKEHQMMEYMVQDLVEMLTEGAGIEYDDAMHTIYDSDIYEKLMDAETGLYRESPSYVFGLLQDEINFGHIVQAEV